MSIRFRFFSQEISYTRPINLGGGHAKLCWRGWQRFREVDNRRPPIHACANVQFCRHTLHGYGSTLRCFDCCMLCEKWSLGHSFISAVSLTKQCLDAKHLTPVDVGRDWR